MVTDIVLFYVLCTINAPTWCYILVGIRFACNLMQFGTIIKKAK